MRKIFMLAVLLAGFLYGNSVTLLDKTKSGNDWKVEVVIAPPIVVNKTIVSNETNSTEADFKTDLSTSVFFLMDTSIPMKNAFKRGIQPLLLEMGKFKEPKETWTVAYFDTDMHIIYDDNKNQASELEGIIKNIPVKGQRTELWRNTQDAIKELSKSNAKRKILILLSDGDAEDTSAYTREDVVKMANDAHIRIASLSYRDTMGTQNLRKISEETNGVFWKADKATHKLPTDFHRGMIKFVRSQGIVTIPSLILYPTKTGKQDINITFESENEKSILGLTVDTEKIIPPKPKPQIKPNLKPATPVDTRSDTQKFIDKYKLYLAGVGVLLLLLILFLLLRKKDEPEEEVVDEEEEKTVIQTPIGQSNESTVVIPSDPIAYFESFEGKQHNIYDVPASIGKSKTSNVTIDKPYISRKHAVLTHKNGYFYITDDNSSNGVTVDGKKIQMAAKINNGTRVGFGPYETVFKVVMGKGERATPDHPADLEKTRLNR